VCTFCKAGAHKYTSCPKFLAAGMYIKDFQGWEDLKKNPVQYGVTHRDIPRDHLAIPETDHLMPHHIVVHQYVNNEPCVSLLAKRKNSAGQHYC
jgi:hypothetical protein